MIRSNFRVYICAIILSTLFGCELTDKSDCGKEDFYIDDAYGKYFSNPSDIYWGVSGGVRSYTYNFTLGNICTKQNPKVRFTFATQHSNNLLSNPFTVNAGTYTCIGVQAQHAILTPNADQNSYTNEPSEIGMNQCFGGQASGTIYPYITVSFNTLGSSQADSIYFLNNVIMMRVDISFSPPK